MLFRAQIEFIWPFFLLLHTVSNLREYSFPLFLRGVLSFPLSSLPLSLSFLGVTIIFLPVSIHLCLSSPSLLPPRRRRRSINCLTWEAREVTAESQPCSILNLPMAAISR